MTDINQYHSLKHDIIQEEESNSNPVEEGDITEAVPNIIQIHRKPSCTSFPRQERLQNQSDSESEEDVTEEVVDSNQLRNNLESLHMENTGENVAPTMFKPLLLAPTPKSSSSSTSAMSTSSNSNFDIPSHSNQQQELATRGEQAVEQVVPQQQQNNEVILNELQQQEEETYSEQQSEEEEEVNQRSMEQPQEQPIYDDGHAEILTEQFEEEQERNEHPTELIAPTSTDPLVSVANSNTRGRSASSVSPSAVIGLLPRSQRVWEMDRQAPECRRCHRRFNFLVRRHHCRRCGQIVCDKCSTNRMRLPVEELIEDPMVSTSQYPLLASQTQRVCDTCYREPIRRSSESGSSGGPSGRIIHQSSRPVYYNGQMRRTDSSQSLMIDCPVCGNTFLGMLKAEQEEHLQRCLNVGSPPVQSPRYIVYELSNDSTQIGDECPICLDEFELGDKISRMICLCSYHQRCLADWLQRGKGCPVHYDSLLHHS